MSLKSNFELMAEYNQLMNKRIYDSASQLNAVELSKNRGAFFGSIIGTLNHILVGDIIWLKRFANHPAKFQSLEYLRTIKSPESLDAILYDDFEALFSVRLKMDTIIDEFSKELIDEDLSSLLSYSNTKGKPLVQNFSHLIQHFFNHQTHHRGQVSTLLNQASINIGDTDLLLAIENLL